MKLRLPTGIIIIKLIFEIFISFVILFIKSPKLNDIKEFILLIRAFYTIPEIKGWIHFLLIILIYFIFLLELTYIIGDIFPAQTYQIDITSSGFHENNTDRFPALFPETAYEIEFFICVSNIYPRDSIIWINRDNKTHRIVGDDNSFDSGDLAPGQNFTHRFRDPGYFWYHCTYNNSLKGEIVVTTYSDTLDYLLFNKGLSEDVSNFQEKMEIT